MPSPLPPSLASSLDGWLRPTADFSQCPFWFWNDALDEAEIVRQLDDFQAHGVDAFVIHPRIGLPRDTGWLSDRLFHFMRFALTEARRRGMVVMLYDEGMYPSGSAGGLVVARDPAFGVRGLLCGPAGESATPTERKEIATFTRPSGERIAVWEQPVEAVVRGLHYVGDENRPVPWEETPPAADLLNPAAVRCFIDLVYDRYHAELGAFFGTTVKAIFTDEPHPLSRCVTPNAMPGNAALLARVSLHLGYDFTPHLPALWFDDEPDALRHRENYEEAIAVLFDESYYQPLSRWCEAHGIALAGHPADPDEIGHLRHFQIPGQDIVWRHIEPHRPSALEGPPSTMAKAAASVAFHLGRPRNLNEFAGAYGEELTFDELQWLASWLLIRGCNYLLPHAFYYSMRGPRRTERPPDVGPNSPWWAVYRPWAEATRRLCWLNTAFAPLCSVAILGRATRLPWKAAKTCFEHQIDFHYIEPADLAQASVEAGHLRVGPGSYSVLIVEKGYEASLPEGTPVLHWEEEKALKELQQRVQPVLTLDPPSADLRARHLRRGTVDLFLLFNEGAENVFGTLTLPVGGEAYDLDPSSGAITPWNRTEKLRLAPHGWRVIAVPV